MKTLLLLLAIIFTGSAMSAQQSSLRSDTIHVFGNCGTCKKKIEKPFKEAKGIESAAWDRKTKMFVVNYDPAVITMQKIKELIVAQGYDTDDLKANDEAYNKLPNCCRYRDHGHDN